MKETRGRSKSGDGPSAVVVKKREWVSRRLRRWSFIFCTFRIEIFFPPLNSQFFNALVLRTSRCRRRNTQGQRCLLFGAANARLLPSQDQRAGVGGGREEQRRAAAEEQGRGGIDVADGGASSGPSRARRGRRHPVLRRFSGRCRRSELVFVSAFEKSGTISRPSRGI